MKRTAVRFSYLFVLASMACSPATDLATPEELEAVELSEPELMAAASALIDQEALAGDAAPAGASTASAPVSVCGWPPVCPRGTQPIHLGCDARCYALYGHDCTWGYNRVDCIAAPPEASISGTPQSVTVVPGALGTTRICWTTRSLNYPVWIRVRVNGGAGQLFTKESDDGSDCENAGWIQAGNSYQFSIHDDDSDASPIYTSTTVTGVPGTRPDPELGPCEEGGSGVCPPGRGCQCGESYCTPVNQMCP